MAAKKRKPPPHLRGLDTETIRRHERIAGGDGRGEILRQVILGGQDGLVNILGIILGVAVATLDSRVVLISGLAATFAESISMAAVAYTSSLAAKDHYFGELEREKKEIREIPQIERKEVEVIYLRKGFRGKQLRQIVKKITSSKKLWLETMMKEELGLYESKFVNPMREAAVVGASSFAGSLIPIAPFFFTGVMQAAALSVALSLSVLFIAGACKAKLTRGSMLKSGAELAAIGSLAAIAGFAIGIALEYFFL